MHYGNYGITYYASITCAPLPSLLLGVTSRSSVSSACPFSEGSLAIPTHTAAAPPPVNLCCALICFSNNVISLSLITSAAANASLRVPSCNSSRKSFNSFSSSLCSVSNCDAALSYRLIKSGAVLLQKSIIPGPRARARSLEKLWMATLIFPPLSVSLVQIDQLKSGACDSGSCLDIPIFAPLPDGLRLLLLWFSSADGNYRQPVRASASL